MFGNIIFYKCPVWKLDIVILYSASYLNVDQKGKFGPLSIVAR